MTSFTQTADNKRGIAFRSESHERAPLSGTSKLLRDTLFNLLEYCRLHNWAGYDPYDGLNSRIYKASPFINNRLCRFALIQGIKRSPVNLRRLLWVPPGQNPKGIALFCSALIKLANLGWWRDEHQIRHLLDRLVALKSPDQSFLCWGYHFDWQNRYGLLPQYEPNIVTTTFAGQALLDAYEKYGKTVFLEQAVSAGRFIINDLNIFKGKEELCFSYSRLDRAQVHNANLLGACLLARLFTHTGEDTFFDYSCKATNFSIKRQHSDGSWFYGEDPTQLWIDHFHTGYNLSAINKIGTYLGSSEYGDALQKGYAYYINTLFNEEGLPKYFHDQLFPIDIHCLSQSIITLAELHQMDSNSLDHASTIFHWTMLNMIDKRGYFYFQKHRIYTNRISYMRWSQAWMALAMTILAEKCLQAQVRGENDD